MLCGIVSNCEIRKALNIEPTLLQIEIPATMVRSCDQNTPGKIGEARPAG